MAKRYMIVDDSPAIRDVLRTALDRVGVSEDHIWEYEDGDAVLEAYEDVSPDIVFMDIQMPGTDALDLVQAMILDNPDVNVITVTGLSASDERVTDLVSYGVFAVLHKPVRFEDIEMVLQDLENQHIGAGRIPSDARSSLRGFKGG